MQIQGIRTVITIHLVTTKDREFLTPGQLRTEIDAMLSAGKIWVGNLNSYWDATTGHRIPGRGILKRAIVSSYHAVLGQMISLLGEKPDFADPFCEKGGYSQPTGLWICRHRERGEKVSPDAQVLIVDCVESQGQLFLGYHVPQQSLDGGMCKAHSFTVKDGEICHAD